MGLLRVLWFKLTIHPPQKKGKKITYRGSIRLRAWPHVWSGHLTFSISEKNSYSICMFIVDIYILYLPIWSMYIYDYIGNVYSCLKTQGNIKNGSVCSKTLTPFNQWWFLCANIYFLKKSSRKFLYQIPTLHLSTLKKKNIHSILKYTQESLVKTGP